DVGRLALQQRGDADDLVHPQFAARTRLLHGCAGGGRRGRHAAIAPGVEHLPQFAELCAGGRSPVASTRVAGVAWLAWRRARGAMSRFGAVTATVSGACSRTCCAALATHAVTGGAGNVGIPSGGLASGDAGLSGHWSPAVPVG